ncbi:MAG: carbohydrate ABC transporter permease, partial [Oscillospiraceae bacterium]
MSKNPNKIHYKNGPSDYILNAVIFVVMALVLITTLYPFLNSLAVSLNNADDTIKGGITFYPRVPTLRNYELIYQNPKIWNAYFITILRTVIGTVTGLFFTGTMAFALSRTSLVGRKFYSMVCLVPMFFAGGLMPTYFLIKSIGLNNSFWVYIIPSLINLWNMILM